MGKQSSIDSAYPKKDEKYPRAVLSKRHPHPHTSSHTGKNSKRGDRIKKLTIKGNPPHLHNKNTEGGYGTLKRRDYLAVYNPVQSDHATVQFVG
jgi:hypothetical protein